MYFFVPSAFFCNFIVQISMMKHLSWFFFCSFLLFATETVPAQKISLDQFKNLKPRSIGPAGMSGRITAIDALYTNTDLEYLGTASGGVWKTENSGATWQPVFDEQPTLNIGSVAIQQNNPSVVWVGTGEGNPRNSLNIGSGVYKTLDGGKTWKLMGLEKTRNIHRIIIDPANPNTVYLAAIGNPYSEHPERGVYKTTDGGESWNLVLHTNDTSGCADLVMDPANPNKLIAAMWQHRRTPWSFTSGGPGSGLYITVDGGRTWKKEGKDDGLPEGDLGRIGLTISYNEPKRVYALVESNFADRVAPDKGIYRGAIQGMLRTLDPHSNFFDPKAYEEMREDQRGRYYGVGMMIGPQGTHQVVIAPTPGALVTGLVQFGQTTA